MPIHRIQLRGPWEYATPEGESEKFERARLPNEWDKVVDYGLPLLMRRRFHAPTNLERNDRVFVIVLRSAVNGSVYVNGVDVGTLDPNAETTRHEITNVLQTSSVVEVRMRGQDDIAPTGLEFLWGGVSLEIASEETTAST